MAEEDQVGYKFIDEFFGRTLLIDGDEMLVDESERSTYRAIQRNKKWFYQSGQYFGLSTAVYGDYRGCTGLSI